MVSMIGLSNKGGKGRKRGKEEKEKENNAHPITPHCTNFVHFDHTGRAYFSFARRLYVRSSRNWCLDGNLDISGGQGRLALYGLV